MSDQINSGRRRPALASWRGAAALVGAVVMISSCNRPPPPAAQ